MPLVRINDRLLYFAHIPKTGGSSIEAYLAQKGKVALLQASGHGWSRCTAQHMHTQVYADLFRDGFYDAGFTVVRDPVDRLRSEYRMRLNAPQGPAPRPSLRAVGRALLAARRRAPARVPDFDSWVGRVFAAYARNSYVNDNHIRPQVEFVHPAHRVFFFEDGLGPVFDWIDEVTGTPPGDRTVHKRRAPHAPVASSPATNASIREFYREDYALIEILRPWRA